jgi:hypothetical protein
MKTAQEEGGVKDGRKPLPRHLIEDHRENPDQVHSRPFDQNAELHQLLHSGE